MEKFENNSLNFNKLYHLLQKEKFTDTILIAGDNKKIVRCNKVMLIASSPYFEELFNLLEVENIEHTTIVLRDINHEYLLKILEYIYCGKVDLHADQILEFKRVASYMKINLSLDDETLQVKRTFEDELDISIATPMSQDLTVDEIIHDFSMNSSISTIQEEEEDSQEMITRRDKNLISLAKIKNQEAQPELKKAKIESWTTYKPPGVRSETCKYCKRIIHEKNPAYHHQRHCFSNKARVPLRCQQCHQDFEFVMSLREHNLKVHRER